MSQGSVTFTERDFVLLYVRRKRARHLARRFVSTQVILTFLPHYQDGPKGNQRQGALELPFFFKAPIVFLHSYFIYLLIYQKFYSSFWVWNLPKIHGGKFYIRTQNKCFDGKFSNGPMNVRAKKGRKPRALANSVIEMLRISKIP